MSSNDLEGRKPHPLPCSNEEKKTKQKTFPPLVLTCSGTTDHGLGLSSSPRTKTNRSRGKLLLALGGYGCPLWSMMLMHRAPATGCKQHRTCVHCATVCCRQHAGIPNEPCTSSPSAKILSTLKVLTHKSCGAASSSSSPDETRRR